MGLNPNVNNGGTPAVPLHPALNENSHQAPSPGTHLQQAVNQQREHIPVLPPNEDRELGDEHRVQPNPPEANNVAQAVQQILGGPQNNVEAILEEIEMDNLPGQPPQLEHVPEQPAPAPAPAQNVDLNAITSKINESDSLQSQLSNALEEIKKLPGYSDIKIESQLKQSADGTFQLQAFSPESSPSSVLHRIECKFTIKFKVNGQEKEIVLNRKLVTGSEDPKKALVILSTFKDSVVELALCNSVNGYKSSMFPQFNSLDDKQKKDMMSSQNLFFNFNSNEAGDFLSLSSISTLTHVASRLDNQRGGTSHVVDADGKVQSNAKVHKGLKAINPQTQQEVYDSEEKYLQHGAKVHVEKDPSVASPFDRLRFDEKTFDPGATERYLDNAQRKLDALKEAIEKDQKLFEQKVEIGGWRRFVPFVKKTNIEAVPKWEALSHTGQPNNTPEFQAYQTAKTAYQAAIDELPHALKTNYNGTKRILKGYSDFNDRLLKLKSNDQAGIAQLKQTYNQLSLQGTTKEALLKEIQTKITSHKNLLQEILEKPDELIIQEQLQPGENLDTKKAELKAWATKVANLKENVSKAKEAFVGGPREFMEALQRVEMNQRRLIQLQSDLQEMQKSASILSPIFKYDLNARLNQVNALIKKNEDFIVNYRGPVKSVGYAFIQTM